MWAGGRWDLLNEDWSKQEPETAQIVDLHEGQVEFTRWFAGWLRDFREGFKRDVRLALAGGERRGGKTFDLLCCTMAALVDVPRQGDMPSLGWLVSTATSERDELDRTVAQILPKSWYRYVEYPKHKYTFAHGAEAVNVSADDPDTLKRGTVDLLFINEAQKMPTAVLTNGIGGTADHGGLAILAANPPRKSKGEWVYDLKDGIESKQLRNAVYFGFDAKLTQFIDPDAKRDHGGIMRFLDPAAAEADDEGIWRKPGDLCYEGFKRARNVAPAPDLGDITLEFTKRRCHKAYRYIGAYDPNARPHHAGTFWKVYGTIADPILWCVDELLVENADGEDHFLDEVDRKGYGPEDVVWVMDASCFFQDDKHRRNGVVSHDYFRRAHYQCFPPQPAAKKSTTGRARNPDVEDTVSLVNKLLAAPRMMVDPAASYLAESLLKCPGYQKKRGRAPKPATKYTHITDTARYLAWWALPRPERKRPDVPVGLTGEGIKGILG